MSIRLRLQTLIIAAAGALAFLYLGLPLPFLLGPLFSCLAAALAGARMEGMGVLGVVMRTILGVAVGASITPALFQRLPEMVYSVALVPLFVLAIGAAGYPFFRRVCGFDAPTAYYASMPGGLQDMLVFGEEAGADLRALSLIHATRVLVIVSAVPFLLTQAWGLTLDRPPGEPATAIPPHELALMVLAAILGWKGGERVGLFGASILGPLIATAALSLTGLLHHRPPMEAIVAAQFFIGLGVGVKYAGITGRELRIDVSAGVAFCLVLGLLSALFAWVVTALGWAPPLEAFLSFAPGGQAEMAVLALISGADMAFIVTHHMVRIITVISGAPLLARFLR
ncbi:AbrB family transcriptional regulator [Oceanomicrobium pacificus]|uniref:AbrB family transcriptional regulator n=1 Tax=Oceanomicrobium pacificus TaxID=2692916 RepID=A0A6B0TVD4_9RHOB|nr:AbrB family transcriptional regulator [Oceanomicrobium pacificus]MXU65735.1 AbrB family transcriptional regulator [Oceanomicrobium pacificus]